MRNYLLTIKQLDKQLKYWKVASNNYSRPKFGWIKTIRIALGMTLTQLANRLELSRSRIIQLENAEINDAVTLRSMREAANAMGCEFVYAIVPIGNTTLEKIIQTKAEDIATERVSRVAHSMSLEDQSIHPDILKLQKEDVIKELLNHPTKELWAVDEDMNKYSKMLDYLSEALAKESRIATKNKIPRISHEKIELSESFTRELGRAIAKYKSNIDIKNHSNQYNPEIENELMKILEHIQTTKNKEDLIRSLDKDNIDALRIALMRLEEATPKKMKLKNFISNLKKKNL